MFNFEYQQILGRRETKNIAGRGGEGKAHSSPLSFLEMSETPDFENLNFNNVVSGPGAQTKLTLYSLVETGACGPENLRLIRV